MTFQLAPEVIRLNRNYIISKKPNYLPKTISILERYHESTEDFIVRRFRFAANCFIEEMIPATYWKLIIRACVMAPHLVNLPKVQQSIKESLNKIKAARDSGWIKK